MKKSKQFLAYVSIIGILLQSFSISPALAAQSTDMTYYAGVDTQIAVAEETTTEEVYVYGLSKDDKAEKKAAKEEEKEEKKKEKEEEKAAKKAQKEAAKKAKEQYKYEKKVQKKKVKENSVKDSEVEWNLQMVNAEDASPEATRKIKLALIDSGVDYTDDIDVKLRKNFVPGHEEVSILYEDISGHGTSVAGILAAKDNGEGVTGINPNLELYSAKVLDEERKAPVSRVVEAIYWAIENDVDIINISFGTTTDSEELYEAIHAAYDAGILIVAAAGNSGVVEYPAAYGEVIAVGSVDNMGNRSEGSAVGDALELVAPGELVLSTGAFYGVAVFSGTSMAAPHVAGIASLLWEKDPDCSADFIRFLLASTANLYGNPEEYGNGVVDYEEALRRYDELKAAYDAAENSGVDMADYVELADMLPVEYNDSEIDVFEDLDYVEGSWNSTTHQGFATETSSESGNQLSAAAIAVVKLGAVAPDIYFSGMTTNPEWHGYSQYNPSTGPWQYYSNPIYSYIYITEIAAAMEQETSPANAPHTITASCIDICSCNNDNCLTRVRANINGKFNGNNLVSASWATLLGSNTNNARNRSLFVYGMAMHTITDMFAHLVYDENGVLIQHGSNNQGGADDPTVCPDRYAVAEVMCQYLIADIKRARAATLSDFLSIASEVGNYDFTLHYLNKYVKAIDPSYYNTVPNKNIFDAATHQQ